MMQFARRTSLVVVLLLAACTSPPTWTFWKETELTARDGRVIDVTRQSVEGKLDRTACALVQPQHEERQRRADDLTASLERQLI
ncbi:MAG: hypothetical protein DMD39_12265 [Gemmatimonadetes bacterium]|nr:MAG: hypothetical protein DMD39_12265 [Gemmatimonadota bacterium]